MKSTNSKWCLTGTPFGNRVDDIKTQLTFIGMRRDDLAEISRWNMNGEGTLDPLSAMPLIHLMKSVVMRHRKSQNFNGRPILDMLQREEDLILIDFSPTEREYYEKLYATAKEQYEYYKEVGSVGRSTIKLLSSLLPARRACSGLFCTEYTPLTL